MKHRVRCAVCALCSGLTWGTLVLADTVAVTTTDTRGTARVNVYVLEKVGSGVFRLTIPLKDIRPDAKYLDVLADFATAKKGDEGYWVFPRGVYGTYRLDQGAYSDFIFYSATLRNIPDLKAAYDAFKPLRHLQKEFMQSHEFLAKDVARIAYSDGSEIVCNYTGKDFVYKGRSVKPVSYELYAIK